MITVESLQSDITKLHAKIEKQESDFRQKLIEISNNAMSAACKLKDGEIQSLKLIIQNRDRKIASQQSEIEALHVECQKALTAMEPTNKLLNALVTIKS